MATCPDTALGVDRASRELETITVSHVLVRAKEQTKLISTNVSPRMGIH